MGVPYLHALKTNKQYSQMTSTASEVYPDVVLLYELNVFQSWTILIKIYNILKSFDTFLLGFRRKLTALALCKSIESAIKWFQIHHRITFATIQNQAVYLSGARVSIFSTLVPRLMLIIINNLRLLT